ncbi:hypothetical protein BGZ67_003615 [Mortierella alpina]|nr:hypothetical protein BGZ67_003615 [Mortierella alpina]
MTTTPSEPLFPPPRLISNGLFVALFFVYICSLYGLFIVPAIKSCRQKQALAFPLIVMLLLQPLLLTCPTRFFSMGVSVTSIAVSTRMIDLYYVQPWTGVPSRYSVRKTNSGPEDAVARAKKDLDPQDNSTRSPEQSNKIEFDEFLNWDKDRFILEMWSPLRKFSAGPTTTSGSSSSAPSSYLRWQDLILWSVATSGFLDVELYLLSYYTPADIDALPTWQYAVFVFATGAFVAAIVLSVYLTTAIVYSISTGKTVDTSEWTMLKSKLPCFALTPKDFWTTWHTLFRYLWVDLGFLPVQRACKRYLPANRVGPRIARICQEVFPVLAVFGLSAIMHGYIVYAVWRESIWSQISYFMIQGVAVIATTAVERSIVGIQVRRAYHDSGPAARLCVRVVAILMMVLYHAITSPLFVYPYQRNGIWLEMKKGSILWWLFGKA